MERGVKDLVDHGRGLSAHLAVDGQKNSADQFVNPSESLRRVRFGSVHLRALK